MNDCERAYLAGLTDGEGCIALRKNPNGGFSLHVTVSQKDRTVLDWIRMNYGGNVHFSTRVWSWNVAGPKANAFLLDIVQYMKIKRDQADYAIAAFAGGRLTEEQKTVLSSMKRLPLPIRP